MAPQAPTSSSSSANKGDDGNDNNRPLVPRSNLNFVMKKLCYMTSVSVDGEDIRSESFVERLLEYVGQELTLLKSIRNSRSHFRSGSQRVEDREKQPLSAYHSNEHDKSSESSEGLPCQNNELVVGSAPSDANTMPVTSLENSKGSISRCPSPEVITIPPTPDHITFPHSSPCQNGLSYDNLTTTPPLSPMLPNNSSQSGIPTWDNLGQPFNFKATVAGTCAGMEDNFINDLIQPPPPPLSRQSPRKVKARLSNNVCKNNTDIRSAEKGNLKNKRTNQLVLKNRCHARGDGLHCTCGLQFKRKSALIQHIRRLTAEKKFKCTQCKKKFYHFCKLKYHLEKQHGIQNPLEKYDTGCSLCGWMFSTRAQLSVHQKIEHNINELREVAPVAMSSQISWCRTPRRPGLSPRRPWMSPRQSGMSPKRPWMSPKRPWMSPRQSGMSSRQPWMSPRQSGLASPNSQKNIRCKKCDEQFQNFAQLDLHIVTNREKANAIQCNSCKKKFIYKCAFKQHQKSQCCSQLNATSGLSECKEAGGAPEMDLQGGPSMSPRNSNLMPPHDVKLDMQSQEEDADNMLVEAPPLNSQTTNHNEIIDLLSDDEEEHLIGSLVRENAYVSCSSLTYQANKDNTLFSNANSLPPPQGYLQQHQNGVNNGNQSDNATSSVEPVPRSSTQTSDSPLPPQINKQGGHKGDTKYDSRAKAFFEKSYMSVLRSSDSYLCVTCSSDFFPCQLKLLNKHQRLVHEKARKVKCDRCKKFFDNCKLLHLHWKQCKNKIGVLYPVSTIPSTSESAKGMPQTSPLQREERKEKNEKGFKKAEGTAGRSEIYFKPIKIKITNRSKEQAVFVPSSEPIQCKGMSPLQQEGSKREKRRKERRDEKRSKEEKRKDR